MGSCCWSGTSVHARWSSHYSISKVYVVVKCQPLNQDEAAIVKAVRAKCILECARQTPHDRRSVERRRLYLASPHGCLWGGGWAGGSFVPRTIALPVAKPNSSGSKHRAGREQAGSKTNPGCSDRWQSDPLPQHNLIEFDERTSWGPQSVFLPLNLFICFIILHLHTLKIDLKWNKQHQSAVSALRQHFRSINYCEIMRFNKRNPKTTRVLFTFLIIITVKTDDACMFKIPTTSQTTLSLSSGQMWTAKLHSAFLSYDGHELVWSLCHWL